MVSWVMYATIGIRAYQFHYNNGIRADGVRSRLECSRRSRNVELMEFSRGIKMKKTTKKVQIYSKVKIDDFWSILIKVE